MSRIHVAMLGGLRIERGGEEIRELRTQPVRCALFLYLAAERAATRDELVALFWPERDAERARRSLNQMLYELRLRLGDDWMESRRDRVEVTQAVTVDALDFLSAVETGRDEEAFAIYGGAFLDGYHLGGTVAFQSWVDRHRTHLGHLHRDLCRRLTGARTAGSDTAGALAVARRWAEMDPLDDEAHHHIITLLAETGRRSEALRHYEDYRELIAEELEVEPLEETKELVARIREGTAAAGEAPEPAETFPADAGAEGTAPSLLVGDRGGEAELPGATRRQAKPAPTSLAKRRRAPRWTLGSMVTALAAGVILVWTSAKIGPSGDPVPGAGTLDSRSIAVLPFLNLSTASEQEYFSDGITEDLLTNLSRIQHLRVISRTSVMRYKQTELPIREIARELGVRYILEGSVRREADQVRITVQLIDAASDAHLWAETYDRKLTDIFQIQSEIAGRIAEQLRHRLDPGERARIAGGGTVHVGAYDLLLRGREYLNRPGEADVRKYAPAMSFFRRSLEIDPRYTRAYVGLSEAFRSHVALPLALRRDSALVYATRAVALDPGSAEAAATLGWAYMVAHEWRQAEEEFRRALELDPNQVEALSGRARLAWVNGRFGDAVHWQRRAVEIDPFDAGKLATLGSFLLNLGDIDGAERAYRRSIDLSPDAPASGFMLAQIHLIRGESERAEERMRAVEAHASDHPGTHFLLGRFHAQRGGYERAAAHLARAAEAFNGGVGTTVSLQQAFVARKLGEERRATALLSRAHADLTARQREGVHVPRLRLQLHALSGDRERALEVIRREWEHGLAGDLLAGPQIGLYWIDHDPLLEDLRADPAFQALHGRIRTRLDSMRLRLGG